MMSSQLVAEMLLIPDIPFQYYMLLLHLDSLSILVVIHSVFRLM